MGPIAPIRRQNPAELLAFCAEVRNVDRSRQLARFDSCLLRVLHEAMIPLLRDRFPELHTFFARTFAPFEPSASAPGRSPLRLSSQHYDFDWLSVSGAEAVDARKAGIGVDGAIGD